MDKKKINEILDQLVIWEPQERVDDRMHIRDREQTKRQLFSLGYGEEEIDEALDEITHDSRMVVDGVNITIPKKIKSIKHQPKLCELNCGQMLINQKIERSYHSWPEPHWRTKCTNCQHYLHPKGDRLVKGVHEFKLYYQRKKR
jgi:hypothetical protein